MDLENGSKLGVNWQAWSQ